MKVVIYRIIECSGLQQYEFLRTSTFCNDFSNVNKYLWFVIESGC